MTRSPLHALARLPARFGLAALVLALALPAVASAEQKIGYFDVKRILAEVEDAKAAKDRLQRDMDDKQKKLDEQKADIERLQRDFEQKAAVYTQAQKEQMAIELQTKAQSAQRLLFELQADFAQKEQQAIGDLIGRLEPVVRDLAEAEGYTYVFEKSEAGLFFAPAGHDLTSEVIRRYNARYPSKAKAATKEKPPAKKEAKK